ncbi:MAG: electron transport complex subunit RsxG [Gammaproteobacteria bacterium]|nr:MAG: electron transport complex subunit RsxG [Gammaproteobacteria bacterium]
MSPSRTTAFRDRISYQALLLGGFSFIATALLVIGNIATHDAIQERRMENLRASLSQVIPDSLHDNDLLDSPLQYHDATGRPMTIYRAVQELQIRALAWETIGKGYAGDIRILIGLAADGSVLGVRVLNHTETPGLGDKIEATRSDWILGFTGRSLRDPPLNKWGVRKDGGDFDGFSGATITARAVVESVRDGLVFFRENCTALLEVPVIHTPVME